MDMNSPLANAMMAIRGTKSFKGYERGLIDAFLMAEQKPLTGWADDETVSITSFDKAEEPEVTEDESVPSSFDERAELELVKADVVPCSFKENVELTDAHISRGELFVKRKEALPSRFDTVAELTGAPPENIQPPSCAQAETEEAPLIIVRSIKTYGKRPGGPLEAVQGAKRVRVDEAPIPVSSSAATPVVGQAFQPVYVMDTFASKRLREYDRGAPIPASSSATTLVVVEGFQSVNAMNTFVSRQLREHDHGAPIPAPSSATTPVVREGFQSVYVMDTFASRRVREHDHIYQRFRTVAALNPSISAGGEAAIERWAREQQLAWVAGLIHPGSTVRRC